MTRNTRALLLLALATAVVVVWSHGGLRGSTIWNLLPLPVALLPLLTSIPMREVKWALNGFSYTILTLVLVVHACHLAGLADLLFPSGRKPLGLPLYAVAAGYAVGLLGVATGLVHESRRRREPDGTPAKETDR